MQVEINGNKTITFTPQGISYILDMLAECPWKRANPLINDIMTQLKQQEGGTNGSELNRSDENTPGGGHTSAGDSGVSAVEGVSPDNGVESIGRRSREYYASARPGLEGERLI